MTAKRKGVRKRKKATKQIISNPVTDRLSLLRFKIDQTLDIYLQQPTVPSAVNAQESENVTSGLTSRLKRISKKVLKILATMQATPSSELAGPLSLVSSWVLRVKDNFTSETRAQDLT
jgi:hypothetical protein